MLFTRGNVGTVNISLGCVGAACQSSQASRTVGPTSDRLQRRRLAWRERLFCVKSLYWALPAFAALLPASANADFLSLRNHRSVSLPFLRVAPLSEVLPAGRTEWSLDWTISNDVSENFEGPRLIREDGEFSRWTLRWRQTDRRGTEWMVEAPYVVFSGGQLDRFIDEFHHFLLGKNDPLREETEPGIAEIRIDGKTFGATDGFAGLHVSASRQVGEARVTAAMKLPTSKGHGLLDTGGVDYGVGIGWRRDLGRRFQLRLHAGIVYQNDAVSLPDTRRWVDQEAAALEFQANSKDTWILQFQSESSALRMGLSTSDAAHRTGALGYRRQLSSGRTLEAFIAEDYDPLVSFDPSKRTIGPDVTLGVAFRLRF
jgi:hypothetical protein